jgi:threonine aldolase
VFGGQPGRVCGGRFVGWIGAVKAVAGAKRALDWRAVFVQSIGMESQKRARHFASDNYSGVCPEVMAALEQANVAHAPSYGEDEWTERARQLIAGFFETPCDVFFVFNGTAANALSIASLCRSYHRVICSSHSHLLRDECGAPGFFAHGVALQAVAAPDGKLTPALVEQALLERTDIHHHKPGALSVTQATELGTVYSLEELRALGELARRYELGFHMDGARLANAIVSLGCKPREIVAGLDVLSLGGTKNGMVAAEAVVFFNRQLARDFDYRRKQAGQLCSKMRFVAAQWIGALESGAWLRCARQANAMAERLETKLRAVAGVRIVCRRQANAVFVQWPAEVAERLRRRGWRFYTDVGPQGAARLMCSWDTTEDDVDAFVNDILSC